MRWPADVDRWCWRATPTRSGGWNGAAVGRDPVARRSCRKKRKGGFCPPSAFDSQRGCPGNHRADPVVSPALRIRHRRMRAGRCPSGAGAAPARGPVARRSSRPPVDGPATFRQSARGRSRTNPPRSWPWRLPSGRRRRGRPPRRKNFRVRTTRDCDGCRSREATRCGRCPGG